MTRGLVGRCCAYPQGQASLLPQMLAIAALVCCFYAIPWTPGSWFPEVGFLCMHLDGRDSNYSCGPLRLVDPGYWSGDKGKYWPVQLGALFAIISAILGSIATLYLFGAICFHLSKKTVLNISKTFLACALFSVLTFVAAALDICDILGYSSSGSSSSSSGSYYDSGSSSYYGGSSSSSRSQCKKVVRLDGGGVAEIFAVVFFLAAAAASFQFANVAEETSEAAEDEATETEVLPLHHKPAARQEAPESSSPRRDTRRPPEDDLLRA
ncbi:unknown protein [Seminavis robusta]|uniref:Uncharacterized protein n=1 Tax=Seminavis robusta TaxID=568900 RepID=A0A9N8H7W1_9STRA|nr:unknown protein [Seminavis robusta]|eukprot:Sro141_g065760.1 n/a (267) ;mRNA; f:31700-32716